jgi:hypothetical protein
MAWETVFEIMIGTLAGGVGGMVKVSTLGQGTYAPKIAEGSFTVDPLAYSVVVVLGDGTEQEHGWLQTEWHINGLRGSQYSAIEAYKTAHTTQLYIRTLKNDGKTWGNYLVNAIFPVKPNRGDPTAVEDGVVVDYTIRFIQAVEQ